MPTIAFYSYLINAEALHIENDENYQKGSYRNKCCILSSQGKLILSVPLKGGKHNNTNIRDVEIDYSEPWVLNHLRAIKSCYGKSPYFEFYFEDIKGILEKNFHLLVDLNSNLIEHFSHLLGIGKEILFTDAYLKRYENPWVDKRNLISPKHKYFDRLNTDFRFTNYDQVFSDEVAFEPNLSILDLLFCRGPEAILYLKDIYLLTD